MSDEDEDAAVCLSVTPVRTNAQGEKKPYSPAEKEQLATYQKDAARAIRSSIKLIAEPAREAALVEQIRESVVGAMRGDTDTGDNDRAYVAIMLEARLLGESVTRPAIRPPTLQQDHARKLVRAALLSRLSADEEQVLNEDSFHDGDQFLFMDGGKHGDRDKPQASCVRRVCIALRRTLFNPFNMFAFCHLCFLFCGFLFPYCRCDTLYVFNLMLLVFDIDLCFFDFTPLHDAQALPAKKRAQVAPAMKSLLMASVIWQFLGLHMALCVWH